MTSFGELADQIVSSGVQMAFGIPGSGATLSLIDELEKRNIPFYLTAFEGSAAIMAATVGRINKCVNISLSIKGPGLANAVPGISLAWFESFPLIHVTEATPPGTPLSVAHKRLNQNMLVNAISKASRPWSIDGPSWQEMVDHSVGEECGPVVFELVNNPIDTADILQQALVPDDNKEAALALVSKAQNPVVIVGSLGIRHDLQQTLEKLRVPVFSTASAKGIVDETLAHAAGVYTGVGQRLTPENVLLPQADLVIGIGLTAREVLATKPFHCTYLAIEGACTPGTDAFEPTVRTGISSAKCVLEKLGDRSWGSQTLEKCLMQLHSKIGEDFLPGQVFYAIQEHYAHNVRIVMDTGYFCTIGEHAWRAKKADQCLISGQGRYMGTSVPMAIGASLADQSVPTIAAMGDGGVSMYLAEAKLAVRNKLPVLFILMTDNMFGSIRSRALKDGLTQRPLTMDGTGWVNEFNGMGIYGTRVDNLQDVKRALEAWKPDQGPAYLEISFDPELYEAMCASIR